MLRSLGLLPEIHLCIMQCILRHYQAKLKHQHQVGTNHLESKVESQTLTSWLLPQEFQCKALLILLLYHRLDNLDPLPPLGTVPLLLDMPPLDLHPDMEEPPPLQDTMAPPLVRIIDYGAGCLLVNQIQRC